MALWTSIRSLLLCYAQVLFSGSVWVGLILAVATLAAPSAAAMGALCAASALLCSWLLQLEPEERHSGGYGYNALLCGLGIGHSCAGVSAVALAVLCGALCALLTAALRASLGRLTLPLLSIPFILVYHMVLAIVGPAGIAAPPVTDVVISDGPALLRGLGALFFLPRAEVGALVLLALLVHSRIAAVLAVAGFVAVISLR